MAEAQPHNDTPIAPTFGASVSHNRRGLWPQKWRWRISLILFLIILAGFSAAWLGREQIAGNVIDDALRANNLDATYEIESIGAQQQVLRDLVIGDPEAPDFTAEQVIVDIAYVLGTPEIGRIELVKPRLYGSLRNGTLSFGALDPVIFAESDEPAGLPSLDITIRDGRARIDSDYGVIGAKLEGAGRLDDGFEGTIGATAPGFGFEGCSAQSATLYGAITTASRKASFDGPIRLAGAQCEGARVEKADAGVRVTLAEDFSSIDGDVALSSGDMAYAGNTLAALEGTADFGWRFAGEEQGALGDLNVRHDLAGTGLVTPFARLGSVSAAGILRSSESLTRSEWSADLGAASIDLDIANGSALRNARDSAAETLAAPLLAKFERGLTRALRGGEFAGEITVRTNPETTSLIIPEARLRSANGETVLALSRVSYASRGERLSGNFLTGGADLPRINGRMEQVAGGDLALRMSLAEYRAGTDWIAIPRMLVRQNRSGQFAFNGILQAEGAIPDGQIRGLELPIEGLWSASNGLALEQSCSTLKLAGLSYNDLTLSGRSFSLCPIDGQPIANYRNTPGSGLRAAFTTNEISLSGSFGETPAQIDAGQVIMRYPGPFEIRGLEAKLGEEGNAVRLSAQVLEGQIADSIGGTFEGGAAAIDAIALDLSEISGNWAYLNDAFRIADGAFTLTERTGPGLAPQARFEPLRTNAATLVLMDNVIEAHAPMRLSDTGPLITMVSLRHDLSSAVGRADIDVPGIRFGDSLQPEDLTYLATGVIALANGVVEGQGQVAWVGDEIDSSGTFRTDDFDFAAAFGPVAGVRGEIVFTDLINLTTAPSQVLEIGSVNPGIEALGGRIVYAMENGTNFTLEDGRWPFMGGDLILYPTTFEYGGADGQNYVFEIKGLDAASFVSQLELSNLGATGIFDGTIQVFFDAKGNGSIERGLLLSQPPGGNISYVGELTYEDLGTMANYAFQTLRSLDYKQMSIELSGNLGGEIITNFNIDGVRQGAGADRNIITRQLEDLPIRFKVNVRSDNFANLALIVRGMFDPTLFDTESMRELLGLQVDPVAPASFSAVPENNDQNDDEIDDRAPDDRRRDESSVQTPESEELP